MHPDSCDCRVAPRFLYFDVLVPRADSKSQYCDVLVIRISRKSEDYDALEPVAIFA